MKWLQMLLIIIAITIISLFIVNVIKKYVLTKYKIKKRYLLILTFVFLIVPAFFKSLYNNLIVELIQMIAVSVTFLTYMEIKRTEIEEKNKPVVGRPKQKPNRVKSNQEK